MDEEVYEGLIPKYGGGRPAQLTDSDKADLKEILSKKDDWTTKEIKKTHKKQIRSRFLRKTCETHLKKSRIKIRQTISPKL